MKSVVFAIASLALASWSVFAQPVQINQATVAASGTNRATGGFPYQITQSGSYQLTGNLVVPANTDGIDILANNVTLDLNGFTISGQVTCTGAGPSLACTGPVSGPPHGILSSVASNITVRNGSVVGFFDGVELNGQGGLVEEIHASGNSNTGILIGSGVARRNTANLNLVGIVAFSSTVTENVANFNSEFGLSISAGGVYGSNTFQGNGAFPVGNGGSFSQGNNACNGAGC
jgi:hypothetical protein